MQVTTCQPPTLLVTHLHFVGLHSEQLALVDLLVLARAARFVGDSRSTFSIFLRERRALAGVPRATFHSVAAQEDGRLAFAPP